MKLPDTVQNVLEFVCNDVLKARWIVSEGAFKPGELGFRIAGVNFWYYTFQTPMIDTDRAWRSVNKREFGEVVLSQLSQKLSQDLDDHSDYLFYFR